MPLSKQAVALLNALPRIGDYIFPGAVEGKPLSDMALMQLLRGMDANGYTVHGFRSTFRDWAGDVTNFDREVIEHALAHELPDKVEAAYRRGTALQAVAADAGLGELLRPGRAGRQRDLDEALT